MKLEDLVGRSVLIVEDDPVIAATQKMILESAGCTVLDPAPGVEAALRTIGAHRVDLALLDVNLGDEKVYPVADALAALAARVLTYRQAQASSALPDGQRQPSRSLH